MAASSSRRLAPARTTALALIGLTVLGLGALRLASGDEALAVPAGATAGDLVLEPCEHEGEGGALDADCGTLVVAEVPEDPGSRLLALPVLRVRARSDAPREPVFFLSGGPGQSNLDFGSPLADRYAATRDVVVVGYRGVDGSVRLDCPELASAVKRSSDILGEASFRAAAAGYRSCAQRLADDGIDVTRYGLVQQVDDLETARVALGYDRVDLISESAGTRTAMIYAWRYPDAIHRSVMIGVNPPGAFLWDADTTDEQIGRYAALCAADVSCRSRTDDLSATMDRLADDVPDRWLLLPIKESNVRVLSLFGLFETASTGLASAPTMIDSWLSAAEGDTAGFWFASILGDLILPDMFVAGQYASAGTLDASAARDAFADGPGDLSNLGRAATTYVWARGLLADSWPVSVDADRYRQVQPSQVATLVVNGALDVSTPPQVAARDLLPHLPNGHEVVLPDFGHTGSFFDEQPDAGTHLVNTFLDRGEVDDSRYEPQPIDFTPPTTHGAVARRGLAVVVALAAVALVSLVVVARAVRTRGRIGRIPSVLLRSVWPLVLGLGGWASGALVVVTTMPAVRIDNELVAVLSVGVPVGLGIHLASVDRDWPVAARRTGLIVALGGGLLGGWLGWNATTGPLALVTTIVGATAGSNLAVILRDVLDHRRSFSTASAPSPFSS